MGKLVEGRLPSLFGGVSRQPDAVRRAEQVQSADNVLLSVTTGGFEKRPATQHLADCSSFLDNTADYAFHAIDRDETEQYFVLVDNAAPDIFVVNAITGAQVTVDVEDSTRYFEVETTGIDGTGVTSTGSTQLAFDSGETTFDWEYTLSDATTVFKIEGSADGAAWNDIATGKTTASGSFSTTIDAVATGDHNYVRVNITSAAGSSTDTITLKATFKDKTYLLQGTSSNDFKFSTVADTTFVLNRQVTTRMAEADSGTITDSRQNFSDLPAAAGTGNVHKVLGDDSDGFGVYYVKDDTAASKWVETVDPTAHNNFDASSLPYILQRQSDGTFHFNAASWGARTAGDETLTPQPEFIGLKLQDVCLYRNRLVLVADEQLHTSRVGEPFELFPQKAIEVLDNDPVTRGATTEDINILKEMTVFKKVLFCTSSRNQFELSSAQSFTPSSAVFDMATSYPASKNTHPVVVGDNLYFPGIAADSAHIYEYFFDEATLSNTAANVTKHVEGYIKNDIILMDGDATSNTLFVMSSNDQNRLYVYKAYFDGQQKLQSAWSCYTFGATEADAFIYGFAVFDGFLVMLIERQDGGIYLEQMPIEREAYDPVMFYIPLIDQRDTGTGTYDSTNDATYWATSWEHDNDARVVIGPDFTDEAGAAPTTYHPSVYTLTLATVAAGETIIINGTTFTAHATTTTAANREFDISGNDIADAGELHGLINDATYGVSGVTSTDNGDGTLTLNMDNPLQNDGITAPTGTAITNATITTTDDHNRISIAGNWSANDCYFGRTYTSSVELSKIFVQDAESSVITGKLILKDITFRLVDAGYLKVNVAPEDRTAYDYEFEGRILGDTAAAGPQELAETFYKVPVSSDGHTCVITLSSDQPIPCVVTSAAWRGFFNEISRQE